MVAGLAMVAVVAVTFAPWLRSGEARRDSHELVRTADRLGIFEGAVAFGLQAAGEQADWGATAAMVIGGVSAVAGTSGLISGRRRRDET